MGGALLQLRIMRMVGTAEKLSLDVIPGAPLRTTTAVGGERREPQADVGGEAILSGPLDVQRTELVHPREALVEGGAVDPQRAGGGGGVPGAVEEGLDGAGERRVLEQRANPRVD